MEITVSDIISAVALIFSIYTIFSSSKLNKLQKKVMTLESELNAILLDKEKADQLKVKKANISASRVKFGSSKMVLKIYNSGESDAYNVRAVFPTDLNGYIFDKSVLPLERLNSMQSCELPMIVYSGFPDKSSIKLMWDDDYQKDNEKEVMIVW